MNIIHSIFSLILKFRAQLITQPWESQQGEAVHPSFIAMQQSYNTFKYYSHFLFKGAFTALFRSRSPFPASTFKFWVGKVNLKLTYNFSFWNFFFCPCSGDQTGEQRLPAPSGGFSSPHQLQQLLQRLLSWWECTANTGQHQWLDCSSGASLPSTGQLVFASLIN